MPRVLVFLGLFLSLGAKSPGPEAPDAESAVLPAASAAPVSEPTTPEDSGAHPPQEASLAPPLTGPPPSLPDTLTAYLVTIGRGRAVWERFGHNLLWIHDPVAETDDGYNYGLFSFEQENFILRFVRGQMEYWMGGFDVQAQMRAYAEDGRAVDVQELALSVEEVEELQAFLEWNELPENRFYRYDYYRDNCSTRVRDALDRILDGRLRAWAEADLTSHTYRDQTLRMTSGLFWISVGMHFGLGPSVDRPLTLWETMFIPMEVRDHLAAFPAEPGGSRSLVHRQWRVEAGVLPPAPGDTPRWVTGFMGAGILGALLLGGAAWLRRGGTVPAPWGRRAVLGLTVPWLTLVGLAGLLIAFLWAFTDHVHTHGNLNLLYATPLHLALAVVWPLAGGREWATRIALRLGLFIGALTVAGLTLQSLPFLGQVNAEFAWLLVPTNLAVALAVWWGPTRRTS